MRGYLRESDTVSEFHINWRVWRMGGRRKCIGFEGQGMRKGGDLMDYYLINSSYRSDNGNLG